MKRLLIAAAFLLAACGSTPKADVAAVEVALTGAEHLGLAYVSLPSCFAMGPNAPLCSKPEIRAKIATYDNVAYASVQNVKVIANIATSTSSDIAKALTAAQQAVSEFSDVVSGLGVQ